MESCRIRNLLFISCVASWYFKPVSIIPIVSVSTDTLFPLMFARVGRHTGRDLRLARVTGCDRGAQAVLEVHRLRGVARRFRVREVGRLDALARGETIERRLDRLHREVEHEVTLWCATVLARW